MLTLEMRAKVRALMTYRVAAQKTVGPYSLRVYGDNGAPGSWYWVIVNPKNFAEIASSELSCARQCFHSEADAMHSAELYTMEFLTSARPS